MVVMIILNIVLIVLLICLIIYLFKNKKDNVKDISINNTSYDDKHDECEHKTENVFVGRFVTDDEYQEMMNNRKSDISMLLKEVDNEYEHLKELVDERT